MRASGWPGGSTLPLLTSDWSAFLVAELGALAALTGFVVVAISINLSRILSFATLPGRAAEALIGPVGAITTTALILVPEQPIGLVGMEVFAIGLVMVLGPIAIQTRSWGDWTNVTVFGRMVRVVASEGVGLTFVVGGALLVLGLRGGLYWVAAGDIASLVAIVLSAWVLMIEILR